MRTGRLAAVGGLLVALTSAPHAQPAAPTKAGAPPSYESTTTAILVDVVVRDRQGRPVTHLESDDFEIREDGVAQSVGSFMRVARGGGIGVTVTVKDPGAPTMVAPPAPAAGDPAPVEKDPAPTVTALVFDALSPDALGLCKRAALEYIPMSGSSQSRVAVFVTEPVIRVLQGYTDNPALLRQGVSRVMSAGTSVKEQTAESMAVLRERRDQLEIQSASATSSQGAQLAGSSGTIGQVEMERRLVLGQLRMLRAFDTLERDHRGYGTTNALFSVLQSLVELPGRKTVVFFSEGLPASPALQAHLQSVVEAANRVNVTVYTIDASGLRAVSGTADTRKEVEEAGSTRLRQLAMAGDDADEPLMRSVERTEDLLQFDSQGGLARLAEGTGGFLVRDTNDLRQALKRIDEDTRFHYLLTYVPTNQTFDGKFRNIGVKVRRPGVQVFARKGYRALRAPPVFPVLDYEAPALAALDAGKLPSAFPFATTVLNFPEAGRPGLSPLLVRVATEALTYEEDPAKGLYHAQATVVARFKNSGGEVVEKVSQQYQLSGRLHELAAAKQGEILFFREPELAPGVYTVETVVHDGVANRASAKAATLEVPRAVADRARLSSIVLVRRTERVAESARPTSNPLYVGDLLMYPNAGEPVSRARDRELTFYYAVYPRKAAPPLAAAIELRRNGKSLAEVPVTLEAAGADGRIQQVSRLPLQPLADGTYELRVIVRDGGQTVERSTFFTVAG